MDLAKSLQIEVATQAESLTKGVHPIPVENLVETRSSGPEKRVSRMDLAKSLQIEVATQVEPLTQGVHPIPLTPRTL